VSDLDELVRAALAEDLGAGDLTAAAVVPEDAVGRARIEQREAGVTAGIDVAEAVFLALDDGLSFEALAEEGEWRQPGPVARVEGRVRSILSGERVALNFLGRLSGVATLTARFVRAVEGTGARILDTRKTTPGLRALEKRAVRRGGGTNHRAGLDDAILVKENHAAAVGGVGEAARRALAAAPEGVTVEIECATLEEVKAALAAGAGRILLDNMPPDRLREAVALAGGHAELEASGGVTLENVREIAETGVDYVSVGALTHSAPALDLSLILERD
jgi:nicotinate-nucleotide pyrophosphorylase (carboxylating)